MAIMAMRDFQCSLCGGWFGEMSGDLMLPSPYVCDGCLQEVWDLDDEALVQYVAERVPAEGAQPVSGSVRHIRDIRAGWESVEALVESRDWWRRP
jgi:hypothetical protein